mgnify:CR=1 FL=1
MYVLACVRVERGARATELWNVLEIARSLARCLALARIINMATTISSTPSSSSSLPSPGSASSSEGSTEASSSAIIHYGQEVTVYEKSLYFETGTGNKVARKSFLLGSQNIRVTRGKSIIQIGAGMII